MRDNRAIVEMLYKMSLARKGIKMWTKDERGFYFADGDIVLSVMNSGRWFFDFRNCPVSAGVAGDAESGKIAVKKSFTEWARNKIKTVKGIE